MKTLIITVGTRQVGWRCQDGVVRSLGADGGLAPPHVDELYQLTLEQQRGFHPDNQPWGVRHLAEQLYALCELNNDFSPVELLLDQRLVDDEVKSGLKKVVLWGTHQPETVPWKFRRLDTLWSAQLMAGKVRQLYTDLQVDVWCPILEANNPVELCQTIEAFILDNIPYQESTFSGLLIENKGSTPAIASAIEICAVALSRHCQVQLIVPKEPNSSFVQLQNGFLDTQGSVQHSYIPIGRYFWPIEKPQIISAWRQGDFSESRLWLSAHRDRYKVLYDLTEYLAQAVNGDIKMAVNQLKHHWLNGKAVRKRLDPLVHKKWLDLAETLQTQNQSVHHQYAWIWERTWLFELSLYKGYYSNSFLGFAQVLEALLSLQCETEDWLGRGYLTVPDNIHPKSYSPGLGSLIKAWAVKNVISEKSSWYYCLDEIRKIRNKIAHEGAAFSKEEIYKVLSSHHSQRNSISDKVTTSHLNDEMQLILKTVAHPASKLPQDILLRSLYIWGLDLLKTE